jgi:uncharacterized phage-like protein YoqJ
MFTIISSLMVLLLVVGIVYTLFTGQLTVEQLIAMVISLVLVNYVLDAIRNFLQKRKEQKEDGKMEA